MNDYIPEKAYGQICTREKAAGDIKCPPKTDNGRKGRNNGYEADRFSRMTFAAEYIPVLACHARLTWNRGLLALR